MPTYATVEDLLRVLPSVGSVTTITSANLMGFIEDTEALVNAKISKLYTPPLSGSALLRRITIDMTLARVLTLRVFTQEQANKSVWPTEYKEAYKLLDQISEGKLELTTDSGTQFPLKSDGGIVWSNTMDYQPTFGEDDEVLHGVDENKLEDYDRG